MSEARRRTAPGRPGFRIAPRPVPTFDASVIEQFRNLPAANIGDVMGRTRAATGLRPFHGGGSMIGPAVTVRVRPGDNLMVHKAILTAERGDIIVVDGDGDLSTAVVGGIMRATAIARGIAGFVIHGAIRDVADFADSTFGCYACGVNLRGPSKEGPGEINLPVSIGGMVVNPGDLIVGDSDGVIAIPMADVMAVLQAARDHKAKETASLQAISEGRINTARFDEYLRHQGVIA